MDTRAVYKRVVGQEPMGQAEFLCYFNDCLLALLARYGQRHTAEAGSALRPVDSLDAQSGLRDIYFNAVVDGIIARKTGDRQKLAESEAGAEAGYRTLWREGAAGLRIKGEVW